VLEYKQTKWHNDKTCLRQNDQQKLYTGRNRAVLGSMYNQRIVCSRSQTLGHNLDSNELWLHSPAYNKTSAMDNSNGNRKNISVTEFTDHIALWLLAYVHLKNTLTQLLTIHPHQLSLAISSWVGAMSTSQGQRAVIL